MPNTGKINFLVLQFLDFDDERPTINTLYKWVFDRVANALRKHHKLRRVKVLVTEKDH